MKSNYHQLINGNGLPYFWWEVATYKGNDETETIATFNTYLEALTFKLQHKDCESLFIDLWHFVEGEHGHPQLLGCNFLAIRNKIESLTENACLV